MSGNTAQTQKLPDIPSPQDIVEQEGKKVSQAWREWFYVLRIKVNSLNAFLVNFAGMTGTGLLTILSGVPQVTPSNVTAGTYGDITHYPVVTVNGFGQITDIALEAVTGTGPNLIYSTLLTTITGNPLVTLEGDFILEIGA